MWKTSTYLHSPPVVLGIYSIFLSSSFIIFFSESLKLKGQIRGTRKTHHNTQNPSQRTNSKGNLLVVSLQRHWRSIGNRCQSWWCGALRPLFPHSLFFFGKLMLLGRRSWNRKETRWERYRIARNKTNKKRPASLWKGKTEKKWRFLRKCKKKCHSSMRWKAWTNEYSLSINWYARCA